MNVVICPARMAFDCLKHGFDVALLIPVFCSGSILEYSCAPRTDIIIIELHSMTTIHALMLW